ncbi:MAG: DUF2953 domain-containing protein [Clostridia bacterium]|nr:DUF2953 domain-containing protein [Clostridia bacterium]
MLLLLLCTAALLCLLSLTVQADLRHEGHAVLRLRIGLGILRRGWLMRLGRTGHGLQLTLQNADGQSCPPPELSPESMPGQAIALLRRADKTRRFLLRHTHLETLHARVQLGMSNAARTALLTGAARALTVMLPVPWRSRVRLHIQPDFIHDRTALQLRCIIRVKLGTLLITSAMLLAAFAAEKAVKAREAFRQWNTRSEN